MTTQLPPAKDCGQAAREESEGRKPAPKRNSFRRGAVAATVTLALLPAIQRPVDRRAALTSQPSSHTTLQPEHTQSERTIRNFTAQTDSGTVFTAGQVQPENAASVPSLGAKTNKPETNTPSTSATEMQALVKSLDYIHENPKNFSFETIKFQGKKRTILAYEDPKIGKKVIAGMQVTIEGKKQIVRGVHYDVPGFGGITIDGRELNLKGNIAQYGADVGFSNAKKGPRIYYKNFLLALAHQQGITVDALKQQLKTNNNILTGVRLPTVSQAIPVDYDPSYLQPSGPETADLNKPIDVQLRAGPNRDELDYTKIPPQNMITLYDYQLRTGYYVDNGQIDYFNVTTGNNIGMDTPNQASSLYLFTEILANMTPSFQDPLNKSNPQDNWIDQLIQKTGYNYKPGTTIIPQDAFEKMTKEKWLYSILKPLPYLKKTLKNSFVFIKFFSGDNYCVRASKSWPGRASKS